MADTPDLGSGAARREGSSPFLGTTFDQFSLDCDAGSLAPHGPGPNVDQKKGLDEQLSERLRSIQKA